MEMKKLPREIVVSVYEQYKRDLQFRMGRDTVARFRGRLAKFDGLPLQDHDIYEMRNGDVRSYCLNEINDAISDMELLVAEMSEGNWNAALYMEEKKAFYLACPIAEDPYYFNFADYYFFNYRYGDWDELN